MLSCWCCCVCVCVCVCVVSDSLQPHGLQPTRLLCPWNFPGKNTGAGCHFHLQRIFPVLGSSSHLSWNSSPNVLYLIHVRTLYNKKERYWYLPFLDEETYSERLVCPRIDLLWILGYKCYTVCVCSPTWVHCYGKGNNYGKKSFHMVIFCC